MNPCSGDGAKPAECSLDGEEQRASSTCPASSREGDQGVAEPATRALMIDGLSLSKQHSQETEESRGSEILTPAADRDDAPKEEPLATVIVAQDKDGFGKCLLGGAPCPLPHTHTRTHTHTHTQYTVACRMSR